MCSGRNPASKPGHLSSGLPNSQIVSHSAKGVIGMQTCSRCKASVQEGVSFCPACGNALSGIPAPIAARSPLSPAVPVAYTGPQETSGKATASLICGIVAYVILPFLAAIPAIILGHLALSDIKKRAGQLKGSGLAIAGMVMGYAQFVFLPVILIIAAIAIPNLLRARMAANEASAVGTLRNYNIAIVTYASKCQSNGYPGSVQNLGPGSGDCEGANLVGVVLATPDATKSGYRFFYSPGPADNLGRVASYTITADPITENTTGTRHFFIDESGVIRASRGEPATVDSPPLQ
jgi:type IV pilus assembly protein PilA